MVEELANLLFKKVAEYNIEGLSDVKRAYIMAKDAHNGVTRNSGEPYIIHPLNVALILADLKVDTDTICAALLHDTVEDTKITVPNIRNTFGEDVANLVDGVTKITGLDLTKEDKRYANLRKILIYAKKDIRVIIIKLADNLHNIRTLQYLKKEKQKENAMETMQIYALLALRIGAYRIMHELQDLAFSYINNEQFKEYESIYNALRYENTPILEEMKQNIEDKLNNNSISSNIKIRFKNIYGIYDRVVNGGKKLTDIHDLYVLKIMVKEVDDCYKSLRYIHELYHPDPQNNKFKDYICNPKVNLYQSIHINVRGPKGLLVQTQVRTDDMDMIASFGLAASWYLNGEGAREVMQQKIKDSKFSDIVEFIEKSSKNNEEFAKTTNRELLGKHIYVSTIEGKTIELPIGATVKDFAYKVHSSDWENYKIAIVNSQLVDYDYKLNSGDFVNVEKIKEKEDIKKPPVLRNC